ncbi:MAG TPA: hypothetical protein DEQ02_03355, partial [Ruminococcaceae bacterium]|nr:hypothetical protein [Oscillospiraceae bacterium]
MRGKILWIKEIKQLREKSAVNLRRRLTVFLLLLTLTMLTGVMFLLAVFGVFRLGYGETEKLFEKELYHLTETAAAQYGGASAQAVRMSERLSESIADTLKRAGFSFAELKYHPELLESLLEEQVSVMLSSLDATGCSGVFLALDTTVNPGISGAENSKAGLYIRNTEPNFSGTGSETRLLLRGPSSLAVEGELNMQAEWDLEFGVKDRLFWSESAYAYTGYPALPLSRLVYWCCESPVPGLDEDVMICSVPLLSGGDEILGVCGFEISEMNFMLRHAPESGEFFNTVFIFSSMAGDGLKLEDALYSGNIAVYSALPDSGIMRAEEKSGGFMIYNMPDGRSFAGMEKTIRLYPDDSPFAGETFAASVVLPKADLDAAGNAARLRFVLILFVLMILGVFASVFLSKRYMKPIMDK